jgi:Tol biopolymer transport system component
VRRLRALTSLVALLAFGLLVGCGDDAGAPTANTGPPVSAPTQRALRLVALRARAGKPPLFNPPRFALVRLRDDGSEQEVLLEVPVGAIRRLASPVWSPDARSIYFVGTLRERHGDRFTYYESDAFAFDATGGEARRLTFSRDLEAIVPSPDGKRLLVARFEEPGKALTAGLWLMDVDGRHERRLLGTEDEQIDFPGSWSPDGGTIAFTRCHFRLPGEGGMIENTCAVYTVSPDGSGRRRLTGRSREPAYSPDGRLISFVSDRDENGIVTTGSDEAEFANELYVMDADGSNVRRLTESESLDEETPSWSPDGSRIAYAREGPASFEQQLMVVSADGTCPKLVAGDAADSSIDAMSFESPSWRPGRIVGRSQQTACG